MISNLATLKKICLMPYSNGIQGCVMGSNSESALLSIVTLRLHCRFGGGRGPAPVFLLFSCLMMGLVMPQGAVTEGGAIQAM